LRKRVLGLTGGLDAVERGEKSLVLDENRIKTVAVNI
jgi:hypothetical protein